MAATADPALERPTHHGRRLELLGYASGHAVSRTHRPRRPFPRATKRMADGRHRNCLATLH